MTEKVTIVLDEKTLFSSEHYHLTLRTISGVTEPKYLEFRCKLPSGTFKNHDAPGEMIVGIKLSIIKDSLGMDPYDISDLDLEILASGILDKTYDYTSKFVRYH